MATITKGILEEINNDPIKFMEKILGMEVHAIFPRLFPSQTYTKTSINSRMETVIEGETRKAEFKLIEYKPERR